MQSLAQWQTRALEALRRGGSPEGLFGECASAPSLGARFGFYREGYGLRTSESLGEDFPLTRRLLGAARFERAVQEYLATTRAYELELGEVSLGFRAFVAAYGAAAARAGAIDLLAVEARRAPDPEPVPGGGFGLHPSARFYRNGARGFVLWRFEGSVLRERVDERAERLLRAFAVPAGLEALGERIEGLAEDPAYVQEAVAEWTAAGVICGY